MLLLNAVVIPGSLHRTKTMVFFKVVVQLVVCGIWDAEVASSSLVYLTASQ